jgi:hypothetical protein
MRIYWKLRHWIRERRYPPVVVIDRAGQATARPQVMVSIRGVNGSMTVGAWVSNDQNEALASLFGDSLSHIAGLRLIDERTR